MRGYKIFGKDYTCKGFKYSLTEPNVYTGDLTPCKSGFHFCVNAIDCLNYYSYNPENTYAIVESGEKYIVKEDKVVCNNLTIVTPLSYEEFGKLLTGDRLVFYDKELYDKIHKKYTYVCGILMEYTEFFKTGRMAKKYKYINEKMHGECIDYHKNGQMFKTCNYENGKLHGEWKMGYEDGEIMKTCKYVNGKIDGECKECYRNGNVKAVYTYVDDEILDGECKEWYRNGNVKAVYTYVDNEIQGECTDFYESGKLRSKSNYDRDRLLQGTCQKWYENGQLWMQCNYKDDEKHGNCKTWFPDGRMSTDSNYFEGSIFGPYHEWTIENGNYIHTFNM
jgi:antitoxin component YwqK of YwqJK toxin-antitoxin module